MWFFIIDISLTIVSGFYIKLNYFEIANIAQALVVKKVLFIWRLYKLYNIVPNIS